MRNNSSSPRLQDHLDDLAGRINIACDDICKVSANALALALAAGDLLHESQVQVPRKWGRWLRENCPDLKPSTARLYIRLAKHRAKVEHAESIQAARRLITEPKPKVKKSSPAGRGQRRAAAGDKLGQTVTNAFRQALSLQKDALEGELAPGVVNALNGSLGRLQSAGLTLHDIDVRINASARRAHAA
jgi:hypothetical protein